MPNKSETVPNTRSTDLEWHLPGMKYCGPGTDLSLRLNEDRTPKPGWEPVDRVDESALRHDIFYTDHPSIREREKVGDKRMIDELLSINNPTCKEYIERAIVVPILRFKRFVTLLFFNFLDRCLRRSMHVS